MRIALAQINPVVGDIVANHEQIVQAIDHARGDGADLVVFPELAILGYPPKDLLLKPRVIERCGEAIHQIAQRCTDVTAIVGYPCWSKQPTGRPLYNAAAVCRQGRIVHHHYKGLLPSYDVFDEDRYFEPGPPHDLVLIDGQPLGISVCEDLWNDEQMVSRQLYHDNPVEQLAAQGAAVFINCSASPYVIRKHEFRLKLFAHTAKHYRIPLVYVNQVGGNDELVFDGNSCVFDAQGRLITHAKDFDTDLIAVDLPPGPASKTDHIPRRSARIETPKSGIESAFHALVLGLRDYCKKCGFDSIVLGLSGGIDSAVSAAVSVAALGPSNVCGVMMPSRYSSDGSVADADELAKRLGIVSKQIPINQAHGAFEQMLAPHLEGTRADAAEENIQARIRGVILMAMSNKSGSLLVTTGNKSELAVGYCTLYGDMAGGLAVLSDVPKTMVWQLARWINDSPVSPLRQRFDGPVIPENSINKPPSAELRPDQTDQDSLPPYDVLDQIIERYVEREHSAQQIITSLPQVAPGTIRRVVAMIDRNEYKRKQAAPGLKITGRAFGFGRRMPIAQKYDDSSRVQGSKSGSPVSSPSI